jgi:hypothetical protein
MSNPGVPEDTASGGFSDDVASGEVVPANTDEAIHVSDDAKPEPPASS